MKVQALRDSSMTVYTIFNKTMKDNPKHFIMWGLEKKAVPEASIKTVEDLVWWDEQHSLPAASTTRSNSALSHTEFLTLIVVLLRLGLRHPFSSYFLSSRLS